MGARNAPPPALDFSFHPQGKLLADVDDVGSPKPMPVSPCVSPVEPANFQQPSIHGGEVGAVASEPYEFFVETVEISPVAVHFPVAAEKATGVGSSLKDDTSSLPSPKAMKKGRVPLERGYIQVEWMKRMQNEPDLAGHKGKSRTRLVSLSEVKKHSTEKDAWTILRGRVYNITPYTSFHPGGREMLLKGAGKDCTALFNKYHAWVNAEFLLEKCLVGVLDFGPEK